MGKIIEEYTSEYDVGDVVIFKTKDCLLLGIIEGYYIDHSCGNSFWYDIRTNKTNVYTYSNKGDIAEWDIIGKIEGGLKDECFAEITKL
jgi:hypothetical protein|nr:MAG TPA: protein of unknown function (DUF951) [Caudoviricetes sp.]